MGLAWPLTCTNVSWMVSMRGAGGVRDHEQVTCESLLVGVSRLAV